MKEDFDKILDMEEIAEQSYDLMEAYMLAKEKANDKLDEASDMVGQAQKAHATRYNITLVEGEDDKITQKIKTAGEALDYYNKMYLIFFKCFKQEVYVMEELQRNDVNALEQNASSLLLYADESLAKLDTTKTFKGDGNLKSAAVQLIKFYKSEAEKDFPGMVDFYIKKDNFEKVKKLVESKSKNERTQQDVDQYNNAVNEYNAAVQAFNKINESTNNQRKRYMDLWNQRVEQFFDAHAE